MSDILLKLANVLNDIPAFCKGCEAFIKEMTTYDIVVPQTEGEKFFELFEMDRMQFASALAMFAAEEANKQDAAKRGEKK